MNHDSTSANPDGSNSPVGVDLLGQSEANFQQFNPTNHSQRTLEAVVHIRVAVKKRGGQPR